MNRIMPSRGAHPPLRQEVVVVDKVDVDVGQGPVGNTPHKKERMGKR